MTTMSDELTQRVANRFKTAGFHLEAMSNLRPRTTGVDGAIIWISAGEFSGSEAQHGPRIKVVLGDKATTEGLNEAVSVRLTDPPVVLGTLPGKVKKQVIKFIEKNREALLQHWKGDLDSKETLDLLEKV
jgi:hypothetical protein